MKYLTFWQKTDFEYKIYIMNVNKYGSFDLFCDSITVFSENYERFEGKITNLALFDKENCEDEEDCKSSIWICLDIPSAPLTQLKINKLKFAKRRIEGSIKISNEKQIMPEYLKQEGNKKIFRNQKKKVSHFHRRTTSLQYFLTSGSTNFTKNNEIGLLEEGELQDMRMVLFDSLHEKAAITEREERSFDSRFRSDNYLERKELLEEDDELSEYSRGV